MAAFLIHPRKTRKKRLTTGVHRGIQGRTRGHTSFTLCLVCLDIYGPCLPSLETRAAAAEDLIHGEGPAAEEN